MTYRITLAPSAARQLRKLEPQSREDEQVLVLVLRMGHRREIYKPR